MTSECRRTHPALLESNPNPYRYPGYCNKYKVTYPYPGYGASLPELTEVAGAGMEVSQNFQKLRVRVWKSYETRRSSGYGYGSLTELVEVPGRYTIVLPVRVTVPRVLCHGRTEVTDVTGTGMNDLVQNMQKFRVRLIPEVNTPGMVLYVPYRTEPFIFFDLCKT